MYMNKMVASHREYTYLMCIHTPVHHFSPCLQGMLIYVPLYNLSKNSSVTLLHFIKCIVYDLKLKLHKCCKFDMWAVV